MLPIDLAIFAPPIWRWAQWSQVRTNGWPVAASLWAISSSWCGKIRSTPPVWMSNDRPEVAPCSSPSTRCASPAGPPRSPCPTTARPASGPSTARSRGRRPCRTRRPRRARRPAAARGRAGPAGRRPATTRCGRRSSRRRSGRRGPRSSSVSIRRDDLVDVLGRPRHDVRAGHPQRVGVGDGSARASDRPARRSSSPAAAAPRMILSSMSVMFITHVTAQPAAAQVADEQVGEQERPEVADVGRAVDRRAAAVDPDVAGLERLERPRLAGQRVVEPEGHRRARRRRRRAARRDRRGRHPPSPARLPVEALTLTRAGVEAEQPGDRVAHRVEPVAEARPRARRSSGRPTPARQAGGRRARRRPPRAARALAMPAASPRRPGRAGRDRRAPPRRAARRRPRGARRRRRNGRAAAARRRSSTPPRASGVARPERMAVVAEADRGRRGAAGRAPPSAARRARSPGSGHLEVVGFAGDRMDGDATGLEQGGLVGEGRARRPAGKRSSAAREGSGGRPAASGPRPAPTRSTVSTTDRRRPA